MRGRFFGALEKKLKLWIVSTGTNRVASIALPLRRSRETAMARDRARETSGESAGKVPETNDLAAILAALATKAIKHLRSGASYTELRRRAGLGLTATMLIEHPCLPLSWQRQRTAFGFA